MNRLISFSAAIIIATNLAFSQGTAINNDGSAADNSAMLDVSSTTKGMLVPRMTETQKNSISSPAVSLLVYQTDGTDPGYYYWDGSQWNKLTTGTGGSGTGWLLPGNAGTTPGTDFLGTTDAKDLVIKTKNTEQVRIDTSGNVGIGNDTAYTKLVVNGGFSTSPAAVVNVTTDNTNITVGNRSYIKINSTRTLASTANITLSNGLQDGQQLIIYNSSASSYYVRLNNTGNLALTRNYVDLCGGSCMTFFWDGAKWIEISRRIILPANKVVYNYTGSNQTFTVPEGIFSIQVKVWGAGGGTSGGGAAYVNAQVGVTPGQAVTLMVGQSGSSGGSYGGGGVSANYGCGGGRSAVIVGGTEVVTAGAGGGGAWSCSGGAAGGIGSNGADGSYYGDLNYPGHGATPSAGGTRATANCNCTGLPTNGSQYTGGNSNGSCSGWSGGGGGCGSNITTGGGGGGSSNINLSYASLISSASGSGSTAGGSGDSDCGGAGNGGANGKIVIIY